MADQVLLFHLHPVPADAGGNDRNPQVPGPVLHAARAEDPGRRDAGDDEEE